MSPPYRLIIPFGGAVVAASVTGYLFYKLFLEGDGDEEQEVQKPLPSPSEFNKKLELKVPKSAIGAVIGRQGCNIKGVQSTTNTTIHFRDGEGDERFCIIVGKIEGVEAAKELINRMIEEIPEMEVEDIEVPISAVGKIIGSSGSTIQHLSRITGAKIRVSPKNEDYNDSFDKDNHTRNVNIRGTKDQIHTAKEAIMRIVDEVEEMRLRIQASAEIMSLRAKSRESRSNCDVEILSKSENLLSSASEKYIPVFVSAVSSAAHFWVQVAGPPTVQLDQLVDKMTLYYNDPDCKQNHTLEKVSPGDIVAAIFPHDNMWYRGRICTHQLNDDPLQIYVYFLDFGDTEVVSLANICELRTDFLRLSFQAIECCLSGVDPSSVEGDDTTDAFESLSHSVKWKAVMAKVVGYKHVDSETIPCVSIVDTIDSEDNIDVAEELVKRGLAKWEDAEVPLLKEDVEETNNSTDC